MSGHLVSPITLSPRHDSADHHPGSRAPLPIVEVESGPAKVPAVYTIAKLDGSGRVPAQSIVHAVGWASGETLTVTADGERSSSAAIRAACSPSRRPPTSPSPAPCGPGFT
jgi:hypothetical protein